MATTPLDNHDERLRAELKKTQDALEAALGECQDYLHFQIIVRETRLSESGDLNSSI